MDAVVGVAELDEEPPQETAMPANRPRAAAMKTSRQPLPLMLPARNRRIALNAIVMAPALSFLPNLPMVASHLVPEVSGQRGERSSASDPLELRGYLTGAILGCDAGVAQR